MKLISLRTFAFTLVAGATLAAIACGGSSGGSDAKAEDEVRASLNEELAAESSGNATVFLNHVTDNWLKTVVGATRDEAKQDPSTFQSDEPPVIDSIKVDGKKAAITIHFNDSGVFDYRGRADAIKEGDAWKLDSLHVISAASVPSGSKKVNIDLTDFAFGFTRKDITSKDNLVFHTQNKGKQAHMMILFKLPASGDFLQLLAAESPDLSDVGSAFIFSKGDEADVVLKEKLAPGRYAFACFVGDEDDPEHTPHAFKGMTAEFTVE